MAMKESGLRYLLSPKAVCILVLVALFFHATFNESWSYIFASGPSTVRNGRVAFAAYQDGNWDIYSIGADGSELRRITSDPAEDRSPAWSPDGTRLAFQSNRGGNWDIYVVSVGEGSPVRLTHDPSHDGAPSWSPDGTQVAFESYRDGDLDVFIMNADGSAQTNLTPSSPAGDFDPTWSPDGLKLALTSGRMGDNDIFVMDLATQDVVQWTNSSTPEGNAVWSRDGRLLAYVQDEPDRREIYARRVSEPILNGQMARRLTWFSHDDSPAWSPEGDQIAYISHQHTNQDAEYLLVQDADADRTSENLTSSPIVLLSGWEVIGPLSWTGSDSSLGELVSGFEPVYDTFSPGMLEVRVDLDAAVFRTSDKFTDLPDVEAPNARLASSLIEPFTAARENILTGTGHDFLSELSDMWRGMDSFNKSSAYLSWHKAGRAWDTLFDYRDDSTLPLMEVVREEIGGETFWRVYLKAARQDGSMGMPLKVHPWDLSGNARRKHPRDGGTWKTIPYGYYVDVTRFIRHAGWERISAIDRREFSWRWHFLAIEYWHHQWPDGLSWYEAMEGVYSPQRVASSYNWTDLARQGEKPHSLLINGVPIPPEAAEWGEVQP